MYIYVCVYCMYVCICCMYYIFMEKTLITEKRSEVMEALFIRCGFQTVFLSKRSLRGASHLQILFFV